MGNYRMRLQVRQSDPWPQAGATTESALRSGSASTPRPSGSGRCWQVRRSPMARWRTSTSPFIATQLKREQFAAKFERLKRRGARSLIFVGLVLVTLNFLFCMAYFLFSLTLEATPL